MQRSVRQAPLEIDGMVVARRLKVALGAEQVMEGLQLQGLLTTFRFP
jgi:hypothetical protein